MKNLAELIEDGFYVSNLRKQKENIADYSLVGSFKAYFSTAEDLGDYMSIRDNSNINDIDKKKYIHESYSVDACNAITQFQHFFELFLKDILLEYNKLLVYDASRKPDLLIKLIDKGQISDSELDNMNFIECSVAIDRIRALYNAGKLDPKYQFIADYFELFEKLNKLRNRIVHRGAFIIHPSALDEIFGRFIIPFVDNLQKIHGYGGVESYTFNLKDKELNPFDAIAKEYLKEQVDENKIHLYKLIGAASYRNKIDYNFVDIFGDYNGCVDNNERLARYLEEKYMSDVEDCPVCGCKSFVYELEHDEEYDEEGTITNVKPYVYRISCVQCGFHIENWMLNKLKNLGVPMKDYSKWI